MNAADIFAGLAVAGAAVTILGGGGVLGWWWRKAPERQRERERNAAVADAILGESEVLDRSNRQIQPARPGLVHRVGTVEEAVVEFRHAIGLLTEVLKRIDTLDDRVKALEQTNVKDIVLAAERAATAAASVEVLRLVRERDTFDGDADEPGGELR